MQTKDFIFYVTGAEQESNGFSIKFDEKLKRYDIKTFMGYGDFFYYNDDIKTVQDLIELIEDQGNKGNIDEIQTPMCDFFDLLIALKIQEERGNNGLKTTYRR